MKGIKTRRYLRDKYTALNYDTVDNSCVRKASVIKFEDDGGIEYHDISMAGIIILMFSVCSYFFDYGSDIYLMITYYIQGNLNWFILTMVFVIIPAIVMSTFSVVWYWKDNDVVYGSCGWVVRIMIHGLGMASIVRYIDTLLFAWKSRYEKDEKTKHQYYKLMVYEEADSAMLRMFECSMESSPQLLLQLYIIFTQPKVDNLMLVIVQLISGSISIVSLSWCLSAYQSSLRHSTPGKALLPCSALLYMVIWKFLLIFPRFLATALFTSRFGIGILSIILAVHYLIMVFYIVSQGTTFCSDKKFTFNEIAFNMIIAYIYCIDYLNVHEGPTKWRYFVYYFLSFCEISGFILSWYFYPLPLLPSTSLSSTTNDSAVLSPHYNNTLSTMKSNFTNSIPFYYQRYWCNNTRLTVVCITIFMFLLGVIFMWTYYLLVHPAKTSGSTKRNDACVAGDIINIPDQFELTSNGASDAIGPSSSDLTNQNNTESPPITNQDNPDQNI